MKLKTVAGISIAFAFLFMLSGGAVQGFDSRTMVLLGLAGATIGAIAAPEFERKRPTKSALWQVSMGIIGGSLVAYVIVSSLGSIVVGALIGAVIGFIAPLWVDHIQLP